MTNPTSVETFQHAKFVTECLLLRLRQSSMCIMNCDFVEFPQARTNLIDQRTARWQCSNTRSFGPIQTTFSPETRTGLINQAPIFKFQIVLKTYYILYNINK